MLNSPYLNFNGRTGLNQPTVILQQQSSTAQQQQIAGGLESGELYQVAKNVLRDEQGLYREQTMNSVDVRICLVFGLAGALCGTVLGILIYAGGENGSDSVNKSFWGLFIGAVGGFLLGVFHQFMEKRSNAKAKAEADARRKEIRRREQDNIEKHDEFVYYDAAIQQGPLYRFFCCPHFGKITSERVIYSEFADLYSTPSQQGCLIRTWGYISSFWTKKVESMDYDMVLDVSVQQTCLESFCDTGTVVLHCEGSCDVSSVKDDQKRLAVAIDSRDEKSLKVALQASSNIKPLAALVERARDVLEEVVNARRADCASKGVEFKAMVVDSDGRSSSKVVFVRDVSQPYQVLDDLSYKITKQLKLNTRENANRQLGGSAAIPLNDVIVDEK